MEMVVPWPNRQRLERFVKFGAVGVAGLGINLLVQAALTESFGTNYVVAAILATQVSSTANFLMADYWVFESGSATGRLGRYLAFLGMNNAALLLRVPMMWVLTSVLGVHYTLSNLASLALLTLLRFLLADGVIWRSPAPVSQEIVTVGADTSSNSVTVTAVLAGAQAISGGSSGPAVLTIHRPNVTLDQPNVTLDRPDRPDRRRVGHPIHPERWLLAVLVLVGTFLRCWQLTAVGFNSDEAVYAGQAAAIAGDHSLAQFFPVIRAHPMLFQGLLSVAYHFGTSEVVGRLASVVFGVGTIVLAYLVAKLLYGTRAAVLAALIVALMPYQVIVDRQVLLDAPTAFFATLTIYLLARFAITQRPGWLVASAGAAGLTVLSKETSVILLVSMFGFLALSPEIKVRLRHALISIAVFAAVIVPFPLIVVLAGKSKTGTSYLAWQLFRRPNHTVGFYATTVPWYVGPLVLAAAAAGLVIRWRTHTWSWREWLLLTWSLVPIMFFQLWPVKGFHYLLGASVPLALLGASGLASIVGWLWAENRGGVPRRAGTWAGWLLLGTLALSLVVPAWTNTQTRPTGSILAGTGGVPGGREAGTWIAEHVPEGAQVVTIGPSMANLVEFYGRRRAFGLSVSPNAVDRNPSYEPLGNPDLAFRTSQVQYVVWDAYSSSRSSHFSDQLNSYLERYHGHAVYTYASGDQPVVTVYEVRP